MPVPDPAPEFDLLTAAESETRSRHISHVHYDIALTLDADPASTTFASATTATFDCDNVGVSTFIDINAPAIESVEVNGVSIPRGAIRHDGRRLNLTGTGLRAGNNSVRVVARCAYSSSGIGLHRFRDPADGRIYMWSHAEPFDAHRMAALFDQPDLKATVDLHVTAPQDWVIVSNGDVRSERSDSEGNRTVDFTTTPPLPTYLIHVSAGEYSVIRHVHRGIPMALYSRRSKLAELQRAADDVFAVTAACLDWCEAYYGGPYPFSKYDQIFCPQFNSGAMENPGAVTVNESAYLPAGKVTEALAQRFANTLQHECHHVYRVGDVTTPRDWGDLWLNESFAEGMATTSVEESTRFRDARAAFSIARKAWAARQDQMVTTHPIVVPIPDTAAVESNFDGISYAKGASVVVTQLRALLGATVYRNALRRYFAEHAWGNASADDFLSAMERESGRELGQWAVAWLHTPGMSTLRASLSLQRGRVRGIRVHQSVPELPATPENPRGASCLRPHRLRIGFYRLTRGGLVRERQAEVTVDGALTDLDARTVPQLIGMPAPDLVLVNDDDLTYAKVRFDERSLVAVQNHLSAIPDPLARAVIWGAVIDMVRDAEMPARDFVRMVCRHCRRESNLTMLEAVLDQAIVAIDRYGAPGPQARASLRADLRNAAAQAMSACEPGSDRQMILARRLVLLTDAPPHLESLEDLLDGRATVPGLPTTTDRDLRWLILRRLAAAGRVGIEERIAREQSGDPSDQAARQALSALAARPTAAAKSQAWEQICALDRPLADVRAIIDGFQQAGQRDVLAPYASRYFDLLPRLWSAQDHRAARDITELAFPRHGDARDVLRCANASVDDPRLPYPATRLLREGVDEIVRSERGRQADLAAARWEQSLVGRVLGWGHALRRTVEDLGVGIN